MWWEKNKQGFLLLGSSIFFFLGITIPLSAQILAQQQENQSLIEFFRSQPEDTIDKKPEVIILTKPAQNGNPNRNPTLQPTKVILLPDNEQSQENGESEDAGLRFEERLIIVGIIFVIAVFIVILRRRKSGDSGGDKGSLPRGMHIF